LFRVQSDTDKEKTVNHYIQGLREHPVLFDHLAIFVFPVSVVERHLHEDGEDEAVQEDGVGKDKEAGRFVAHHELVEELK
jgi:hypothetical protein